MSAADMDKVLSRVKKMMALANDAGASEGERDNALRMAHATLAKHNLSMAQVETLENSDNDPRTMNDSFDLEAKQYWARQVASGVSKLFFCYYYRNSITARRFSHCFVGKSLNVTTATLMTEYLINSIKRESEKAVKAHYADCSLNALLGMDGIDAGSTAPEATKGEWQKAFCEAAARVVKQRCIDLAEAARGQKAEGTGTSLVLADYYKAELDANKAFIRGLGIRLTTYSAPAARSVGSANAAGQHYGSSLSLNQQIAASSSRLRLK